MHTSDQSAPSESPERSSSVDAPDAEAPDETARCGAIVKKTGRPCRNFAVKGGRCRWHLVDELVPESESEALRQLQEAAAQHALDAFHAIEGGENGDQDAAFNRNARTAAQLARIRRDLVKPKPEPKDGEGNATAEPIRFEIDENKREPNAPATSDTRNESDPNEN